MLRIHKQMQISARALIAGSALSAALAGSLEAADLQKRLVVTDAVVRLSDLFTDTGANGELVVMEAPAPGRRKAISNYELVRIAEKHEVDWDRPPYLKRVYLEREGQTFSLNDLQGAILELARDQDLEGDVVIHVFGRKTGLYLPHGLTVDDIAIENFELSEQRNRFSALLKIPTGTAEITEQRISGTIEEIRLVPVFNRVMSPGEVISDADIEWRKYPIRRILRNSVQSSSQLIGHTVKRPSQAGKLLKEADITMPVVVAKGSIVLMTYTRGRLSLTMQARALENGGTGDTIRLMNQKSKKTVFGKVIGEDHVEVAATPMLKLASR